MPDSQGSDAAIKGEAHDLTPYFLFCEINFSWRRPASNQSALLNVEPTSANAEHLERKPNLGTRATEPELSSSGSPASALNSRKLEVTCEVMRL